MTGRDFVALSLLPAARRRATRALAALPQETLDAPDALELLVGYCAREAGDTAALVAQLLVDADGFLARGRELDITAVALAEADYPASLRAIPDPPVVLWVAGRTAALTPPGVAVIVRFPWPTVN